jgi:hypothetical protein
MRDFKAGTGGDTTTATTATDVGSATSPAADNKRINARHSRRRRPVTLPSTLELNNGIWRAT